MKTFAQLLSCCCLIAVSCCNTASGAELKIHTDLSQKEKPPTVKVLLLKDTPSALVETRGGYSVYNAQNGLLLASSSSARRHSVSNQPDGITWDELFLGIFSIRIVPADAYGALLVNGIEYRGCVEVHGNQNNCNVINEVDVERYLKSILTFQLPEEIDSEVLEAAAIAARTYAYFCAHENHTQPWQIVAQDTGYQGSGLTLQNLPVEQAITNTRHVAMTFRGNVFPAAWTKNSAGKTAEFSAVFRKNVTAPRGVVLPLTAKERPRYGWFFEISKQQLAHIIGAQTIDDIALYQDKESEKIYAINLKSELGSRNVDFFTLQKALGSTKLKSNDFQIRVEGDKVCFTGYGEGHGVGLCLLSAKEYADKGENAQQILTHFFPGAQLHCGLPSDKEVKN
jgi:stage II sporulation protein D